MCRSTGSKEQRDVTALLREALIAMRELAVVAHNGDPWYAEQEGLDAAAIFEQARIALGEDEGDCDHPSEHAIVVPKSDWGRLWRD